jgi:hypothetical protein
MPLSLLFKYHLLLEASFCSASFSKLEEINSFSQRLQHFTCLLSRLCLTSIENCRRLRGGSVLVSPMHPNQHSIQCCASTNYSVTYIWGKKSSRDAPCNFFQRLTSWNWKTILLCFLFLIVKRTLVFLPLVLFLCWAWCLMPCGLENAMLIAHCRASWLCVSETLLIQNHCGAFLT